MLKHKFNRKHSRKDQIRIFLECTIAFLSWQECFNGHQFYRKSFQIIEKRLKSLSSILDCTDFDSSSLYGLNFTRYHSTTISTILDCTYLYLTLIFVIEKKTKLLLGHPEPGFTLHNLYSTNLFSLN